MAGRIVAIPATKNFFTNTPIAIRKKKRVAAYARVSTDEEEQQNSYEAQIRYYSELIQSKEEWEYVDVYADEGISGTRTSGRDGFKKMIADALAGKIDLIITKSVSRFARNTVDSLSTIRELRAKGVEVYFEKENIYTLDSKGELLLTIMASLAQEESRSISENVTWGKRRSAAAGKVSVAYAQFLGYDKGMKINEEEAKIVRRIYREFLNGKSPSYISRMLDADGIRTPSGRGSWRPNAVESILTNEKYKGDALLQKTFTTDFLTHTSKKNEGEVQQYYITGHHDPIIDPAVFDAVQEEMKARKGEKRKHCTPHPFSGRIYCAQCGGVYGSKDGRTNMFWRCNNQHKHKTECTTHQISTKRIQNAFVMAFNRVFEKKAEVMAICETMMRERCCITDIEREMAEKQDELNQYMDTERNGIRYAGEDASVIYERMKSEEQRLAKEIEILSLRRAQRLAKKAAVEEFMATLRDSGRIVEYDDDLMFRVLDRIEVEEESLRIIFRGGQVIEG